MKARRNNAKGIHAKMKNLYDEKGYHIMLECTQTFNPKQRGESEDARDLGVFFTYIGAASPTYDDAAYTYENDAFVVSRFDAQNGSVWNPNALAGFYGMEPGGTWGSACNALNIKDPGIFSTGLKIVYIVPPQLEKSNAVMKVWVNDELMKEVSISEAGEHTLIVDVKEAGKKEREYLENAQRILKILLKDFDRVCQKYNLKYYVICGSLLGAVRHHDLVPWDDDIDVAMPRKDFDILMQHVKEEWGNGGDILFVNYNQMGNHSFLDFMTRIIYMKEEIPVGVYRKIHGKGRSDIENHMPLDIYVLDNAADSAKKHQFQMNLITLIYGLAIGHRAYVNYDEYNNRDKRTQRIVKTLSAVGKCIPLSLLFKCYEIVRKWNKNKNVENYYESNGFIYCIPWKFKQEWFGEGTRIQLGELSINVPSDYESFLKMHYRDYHQFPPMEARRPTHSVDSSGIF